MESSNGKSSDVVTEGIIGAAIEVHRILGPGLLESIYEEALCIELGLRGFKAETQRETDVCYKGHIIKGLRIDLLIEEQVIVELKSLSRVPEVSQAPVLSYLKATGLKRALILNFGLPRLVDGIQRLSN